MNWVTIIWSMSAAVPLTLGAIHVVVWLQDHKAWANLLFAVMAVSVATFAGVDLSMLRAETAAQFAVLHRWVHVPLFFTIVSLIGFILYYFRSGRVWLAWTVIGLRAVVLIIDFTIVPTVNYRAVTGLLPFHFLGDTVSVPVAVRSPWSLLGEGSALLVLIFVVDASISLWRRGNANERRRAMVVGGSVGLFISITLVNAYRVHTGAVHGPYFVSLFFVLIVVAMGYELSRDVIAAGLLARELRENEHRMSLAAESANLGLWAWDVATDRIWATEQSRELFGLSPDTEIRFQSFLDRLHPDDRERIRREAESALREKRNYAEEYRLVLPNGDTRWVAARGGTYQDRGRGPVRMLGVVIDITERKQMEIDLLQQRQELAHVTRVSAMGELAASMAHELNQPLAAILSNAQAGQRFMAAANPDLEELREILKDIVSDDKRAGEVIRGLRALMKNDPPKYEPLDLNLLIKEVVVLVHGETLLRNVVVETALAAELPRVSGDRTQLQQVMLNLLMNAVDAMEETEPARRRIAVRTESTGGETVRISVRDNGCGLAPEQMARLFEAFHTTKHKGMGMGLSVCRSIVTAHGGQIWAENNREGGATFQIELPVEKR